ncbi:MAG: MCE family protein [Fibrobacter sp.]|nr:MCE family protein [Fibrobacter sp.]
MNRVTRRIKENLFPFIAFAIIVASCSAAWFFFHPSSPYHERYSFVVSYDAIGTLSPGNLVKVRGIPCGEIIKVELTDDAVYVTVKVLAGTIIPRNSEFRLITAGLMGEREMCVLTGDSKELVQEGDTLIGHFEQGMSGFGKKVGAIMADLGELRDSARSVLDSLSDGQAGEQLNRVSRKAKTVVRKTKVNVNGWKAQVDSLLDECDHSLGNAQSALEAIAQTGAAKVHDLGSLVDRTRKLLETVKALKEQSATVLGKLTQDDNTAGLIISQESPFNKGLDKLLVDVDALLNDIKKSGLDINVDIF